MWDGRMAPKQKIWNDATMPEIRENKNQTMEGNREAGSKNVNQINEDHRAWRGIMQFIEGGVQLALTNNDEFAERINPCIWRKTSLGPSAWFTVTGKEIVKYTVGCINNVIEVNMLMKNIN